MDVKYLQLLGLEVGCVLTTERNALMKPTIKTLHTEPTVGFDYLRDNMKFNAEDLSNEDTTSPLLMTIRF